MSAQDIAGVIGGLLGFVIAVGLLWVWPITAGLKAARKKNRSPHWMWFGIYPLGGWIAYAVLRSVKPLRECPHCAEKVKAHARQCPYCGHQFDEVGLSAASVATQFTGTGIETAPAPGVGASQHGRPKVISVLAVLLVVGGLSTLVSLPYSYAQNVDGRIEREVLVLLHRDAAFHGYAVLSFWLGALLAIPTIVVGTGLWRLRTWALVSAVWLLWWSMLAALIGTTVLNYAIWFGATPEVLASSQQAKFERFAIWVVGTLTGLVMLGLYGFFLARLRTDPVRTQFT